MHIPGISSHNRGKWGCKNLIRSQLVPCMWTQHMQTSKGVEAKGGGAKTDPLSPNTPPPSSEKGLWGGDLWCSHVEQLGSVICLSLKKHQSDQHKEGEVY